VRGVLFAVAPQQRDARAPPPSPSRCGTRLRLQIVVDPGEIAVVVVSAEGKVVVRHASTIGQKIVKHKRLFLLNR
jgi:hypothetical protein